MARFYADENFPRPVVLELRQLGHDVLTALESGWANKGIPDQEVLEFATREKRTVLTLNRFHFVRLAREHPDHAGIIACSYDRDYPGQVRKIQEAVTNAGPLDRQVIRIYRST